MTQELSSANGWVVAHPQQYEQLFDDGLIQGHEVNFAPEDVSLSALARYTFMKRRPRQLEYTTMAEVAQGVDAVLAAHEQGLFGTTNTMLNDLEVVSTDAIKSATTRVISHWERACLRRDIPSPFADMMIEDLQPDDGNLNPTQLVLMTAAALALVLEKHHFKPSAVIPMWAEYGIKYFGPQFTSDFIEGGHLPASLGEEALSAHIALTPSERKVLLARSPQKLAENLVKIGTNLEIPSQETLATMLGWSVEKTNHIFTRGEVRKLAYTHRARPFIDVAKRIGFLYDEVLKTEDIADALNITSKQAEATFNPSTLHRVVFNSPDSNPIDRFRDILALTRTITNTFHISYPLAVWMATCRPGQALDLAALVEQEQSNRPYGITEDIWAWAVAGYPREGDPRRLIRATKSSRRWNLLAAILPDSSLEINRPFEEKFSDLTYAPEHVLFGDDALSNLRDTVEGHLAKADLSSDERRQLLEFFGDVVEEPSPVIEELLQRVRQATSLHSP